eukprot:8506858-Pyramimonas_sp.AAC.1
MPCPKRGQAAEARPVGMTGKHWACVPSALQPVEGVRPASSEIMADAEIVDGPCAAARVACGLVGGDDYALHRLGPA